MLRKTVALICLCVLTGGGCAKKAPPVVSISSQPADKESTRSYARSEMAVSPSVMGGGGGVSVLAASRLLVVRQRLVVVAPGAVLAKSLEAVIAFAGRFSAK